MNLSTDIQITLILSAFCDYGHPVTAIKFTMPDAPEGCAYDSVEDVAEAVFAATNLSEGPVWDVIQAQLPEDRSHTSMSVGDLVVVNGSLIRCDSAGWTVLTS